MPSSSPRPARHPPADPRARSHGRDSHTTALLIARAALDKHAEDIIVLDLRLLSTVTDFFVICTADNPRQIAAIRDHIEATLKQRGLSVWHAEGVASDARVSAGHSPESQWVLLDCGAVVVHLLDASARTFYRLEELWADAPRLPLSA